MNPSAGREAYTGTYPIDIAAISKFIPHGRVAMPGRTVLGRAVRSRCGVSRTYVRSTCAWATHSSANAREPEPAREIVPVSARGGVGFVAPTRHIGRAESAARRRTQTALYRQIEDARLRREAEAGRIRQRDPSLHRGRRAIEQRLADAPPAEVEFDPPAVRHPCV